MSDGRTPEQRLSNLEQEAALTNSRLNAIEQKPTDFSGREKYYEQKIADLNEKVSALLSTNRFLEAKLTIMESVYVKFKV